MEISPGHPLHGASLRVLAKSTARDDVLVALSADRWAIIHLTWKRAPETPPSPHTVVYNSAQTLEMALLDD